MNTFATIGSVYRFKKVTYYTLTLETEETKNEVSEFGLFLKENKGHERMPLINDILSHMGDIIGADATIFRPEGDLLSALPPSPNNKILRSLSRTYSKLKFGDPDLRLYCMRVSDRVVFLFGGGNKTELNPLKCPNVREPFKTATSLSKSIQRNIDQGNIQITQQGIEYKQKIEL